MKPVLPNISGLTTSRRSTKSQPCDGSSALSVVMATQPGRQACASISLHSGPSTLADSSTFQSCSTRQVDEYANTTSASSKTALRS